MTPDLEEVVQALDAARPTLDAEEQLLALTVYRSLAGGEPVTVAKLSREVSASEGWVADRLEAWPGVFRDAEGRVIGFWGLALPEMDHVLEVDGRRLYTWCAWDPLFIAPILGALGRVTSHCPVTGRHVTLTVGPDGIADLDPPGAVLSFLAPDGEWDDRVIERFCHFVRLFASHEAAEEWTGEHPGTFVMSVEEGFELGRRTLARFAEASP